MSRLLLALECATSVASVALLRDGELVCEETAADRRQHAETLLGLVDAVLERAEVSLDAVDAFAVSVGPGSFTSLRVGIATVKGLAFESAVPVAPVSTLEALAVDAAGQAAEGRPVAALLDARRDEVYAGLYGGGGGDFPEGVYAVEEIAGRLPATCLLAGSGAELYAADLAAGAARVLVEGCVPRAQGVGLLGLRALARGEGVAAADLAPRYLRRSDAEVRRGAFRPA